MAVKCAAMAESRKRSVSVTENILDVTGRDHSVLQQVGHYEDVDLDSYDHQLDEQEGEPTLDEQDEPTNLMGDGPKFRRRFV